MNVRSEKMKHFFDKSMLSGTSMFDVSAFSSLITVISDTVEMVSACAATEIIRIINLVILGITGNSLMTSAC